MASVKLISRRLAVLLLCGLLCALLVRYAPGFDVDEREWDQRLGEGSRASLQAARAEQGAVGVYYVRYLWRMVHGDLGVSQSFGTPVLDLIRDRLPATLRMLVSGWLAGTVVALGLAALTAGFRSMALDTLAGCMSAAILSIPSGLLGIATVLLSANAAAGIAVYVVPRVFEFAGPLFRESGKSDYLAAARARGIPALRLLVYYRLPAVAAPMAAVLAVTFCAAFGAAVPIEMVTDTPGVGQLAWKAALGRDIPLLLAVTFLAGVLTITANTAADLVLTGRSRL